MGPQAITALMDGLVTMTGFVCLIYYSINRKWNKDDLEKMTGFAILFVPIVRYRVEIIIATVLIPDWFTLLPSFFGSQP